MRPPLPGDILVVDDSLLSRKLLTGVLTAAGCEVRSAESGELALASVAARAPELILLDIRMPDMDGFEVIRRLKARKESRDVPVMFLSAGADLSQRVEGLRLGAVDFIPKPFQDEELLARVRTHLEMSRLRARLEQQAVSLQSANDLLQSEITQRQRATEELQRGQAELSEAQRIAGMGSWDWVPGGDITWSPGVNRILVRDPGSPAPTFEALPQFYTPESWRSLESAIARAIEAGEPYELELEMVRADGTTCWTTTGGEALRGPDGTVVRLRGTVHDISAHKRSEQRIRELHRQISSILESVGEGIFGLNLEGEHTFVNPAAAQLVGYEVEELIGRRSDESWHGIHRGGTCPIYATFRDGAPHEGRESFWRKDGTAFPVRFSSTPIWQGERLAGTVVSFTDITQELAMQKALARARELEQLGHLVAGLAHEVRNPLQSISAGCAALRIEMVEDEPRLLLDLIQDQVERVSHLMKDLLELGRPVLAESFREISLVAVLAALSEEWGRHGLAEAHPLVLFDPRLTGVIRADDFKLVRALLNLLENAAQHAPQGEGIALRVTCDGRTATIRIEDRGPGILPSQLAQAFDPFFTLRKGGTGLGLSIVRHVVESHGGSVTLENRDPGPGLCATVTLPASGGAEP